MRQAFKNYRGNVKWSVVGSILPVAVAVIAIGWATAANLAFGQFSSENLFQVLIPMATLGVILGKWLVRPMSRDLFHRVTYAATIIVANWSATD